MNPTTKAHSSPFALAVEGMTCGHCKARVEKTLGALDGVSEIVVDLEDGTARVALDDGKTSIAQVTAAISAAGYPARVLEG